MVVQAYFDSWKAQNVYNYKWVIWRWPRDDITKHVSKDCHWQTDGILHGEHWSWLPSCAFRRTLGSLKGNASGLGLCCYCLSNRAKVNIKNHLSDQRAIVRPACPAASIVLITEKQGGHARLRIFQWEYLRRLVVDVVHCRIRHLFK